MDKKDQVTVSLRDLFNKMAWLNKHKMEDILKDYKSSEVHCIEYIGRNLDSNVTTLANSCYMTRGAISKTTKKLIQKGIIESYQKSDNKKEIYFKLTKKGIEINKIHDELHKEFQARDRKIFDQITDEQYDSVLSFIEKYNNHLDLEIKKLDLEIN